MAKVRTNVVVQGISGGIGALVFRQMPNGETYVSGSPDFSRRKFSQGQKDHQSRFRRAAVYARDAAKQQPIYAKLAKGTVKSPYNIALSDWFNPPVIHAIERKDRVIQVRASDNVMVTKVEVTIRDEAENLLAKGLAVSVRDDIWECALDATGSVMVRVWDLAGNVTEGIVNW